VTGVQTCALPILGIHFMHVVGEAEGNRPLLLTHGWPGSVFEFHESMGPLAYPSKHGGKAEDAFDLIIPSLPGFGFSGKPKSPIWQRATAKLWNTLIQDVLGYETYLAQGGDWGGMVTSWLGFDHGAHDGKGGCEAIHLNMIGLRPNPATPQNDDELKWLQQAQAGMQMEGSYFMQQATKPQTLAMSLMDSPMGTAAWILEKFHGWSDLDGDDLYSVYTRDQLLTNIMIYLVTGTFNTATWFYRGMMEEGGSNMAPGDTLEIPTGFMRMPEEGKFISIPPRSMAEKAFNIIHWTEPSEGGHFAALETGSRFCQ